MKHKIYHIIFFTLLANLIPGSKFLFAQNFTFVKSIPIDQPGAISTDRLQNIYISDRKNNLYKLDQTGKVLQSYSPPVQAHIASVEAWNMVKTVVFYDDRQQITLLDRFLTPISTTRLSDITTGVIRAATISSDDRIWLFNESDFSLLKLDLQRPDNINPIPLNQILNKSQSDIRFMREYQNNLYIIDRASGIYIFDNMGNYKKKLPFTGLSYLGFSNTEGYYIQNNQLIFIDLYTLKERKLELPAPDIYKQALVLGNSYYFFSDKEVAIYQLK